MTRRAAVTALLCCASLTTVPGWQPSHPGWTEVATGVTARLRGLSAASSRVIWASGTAGTVIRTADGGATWQRLQVPDAAALDFRDIDAVDDRTAYLLSIGDGDASRIYKTTDAGASWTLQFRNDNPRAFFDAMVFRDARTGFAVSDAVDGRLIVLATSDGEHWTPRSTGMPAAVEGEGAFAASGSNIAVQGDRVWIGTSKSRVFRSTDRGRSWHAAATPLPTSASAGIFSIAFADPAHGIIVGGDYKAEAAAVDNAALTSDGGATWSVVRGLGGFRSAVGYVTSGPNAVVVAVGPSGSDRSSDGGRTWSAIGGPGFHTLSIVRGMRTVWAAGENGRVAFSGF